MDRINSRRCPGGVFRKPLWRDFKKWHRQSNAPLSWGTIIESLCSHAQAQPQFEWAYPSAHRYQMRNMFAAMCLFLSTLNAFHFLPFFNDRTVCELRMAFSSWSFFRADFAGGAHLGAGDLKPPFGSGGTWVPGTWNPLLGEGVSGFQVAPRTADIYIYIYINVVKRLIFL